MSERKPIEDTGSEAVVELCQSRRQCRRPSI